MSDREYWEQDHPVIRLRIWVLGQMIWGAFLAGIFLLVIVAIFVATWVVGEFLPEESKQAPSPYGALEIVQTTPVA